MSLNSFAIDEAVKSIVVIASSGSIVLALYNRHLILVQRLRGLNREVIDLYHKRNDSTQVIMNNAKQQIKELNKNSRLLITSIIFILVNVNVQLLVCILSGFSNNNIIACAHVLFIFGCSLLMVGVSIAIWEISNALQPILKEEVFVLREFSNIERDDSANTINIMNSMVVSA